jgi:hypothetical protein
MKYNTRDLAMSQDYDAITGQWQPGDLQLAMPAFDYNGQERPDTVDLATCIGYDNLRQMITVRMLTRQGDYTLRPGLGQNFASIMGRRMTSTLVEQGRQLIIQALTYDNYIDAADIAVTGIPFDRQTILYSLAIHVGNAEFYKFTLIHNGDQGAWRLE